MKRENEAKKMAKLKLNQLSKAELNERSMDVLKGGVAAPPCNCNGGISYVRDYWKV